MEKEETVRRDLMEVLVCPVCKGALELEVDQEKGDEVVTGRLICTACAITYRIEDSIPDMLPPQATLP